MDLAFSEMYLRVSNFGNDFKYLLIKVPGVYEILLIQPIVSFFCSQLKMFFWFLGSKPWAMDLYILGSSEWCIQQKTITCGT